MTADGRLHTITYPSGKVATHSYNSNGQVSGLTFNSDSVAGSLTWMPFGGINTWSTYSSTTFTRSFDEDYRITSLALGSVNTQSLTWDVASRLTGLTETSLSAKSYGYDDLDRLTRVTIGTASPTSWTYDDNGNRTKTTDPSSNVTNYNYTTDTNILASLSGHVAQTFTTDAAGNMTGDGTNTWTYDQRGSMATQTVSSVTTTYSINDLGLRVKKPTRATRIITPTTSKVMCSASMTAAAIRSRKPLISVTFPLASSRSPVQPTQSIASCLTGSAHRTSSPTAAAPSHGRGTILPGATTPQPKPRQSRHIRL